MNLNEGEYIFALSCLPQAQVHPPTSQALDNPQLLNSWKLLSSENRLYITFKNLWSKTSEDTKKLENKEHSTGSDRHEQICLIAGWRLFQIILSFRDVIEDEGIGGWNGCHPMQAQSRAEIQMRGWLSL